MLRFRYCKHIVDRLMKFGYNNVVPQIEPIMLRLSRGKWFHAIWLTDKALHPRSLVGSSKLFGGAQAPMPDSKEGHDPPWSPDLVGSSAWTLRPWAKLLPMHAWPENGFPIWQLAFQLRNHMLNWDPFCLSCSSVDHGLCMDQGGENHTVLIRHGQHMLTCHCQSRFEPAIFVAEMRGFQIQRFQLCFSVLLEETQMLLVADKLTLHY